MPTKTMKPKKPKMPTDHILVNCLPELDIEDDGIYDVTVLNQCRITLDFLQDKSIQFIATKYNIDYGLVENVLERTILAIVTSTEVLKEAPKVYRKATTKVKMTYNFSLAVVF